MTNDSCKIHFQNADRVNFNRKIYEVNDFECLGVVNEKLCVPIPMTANCTLERIEDAIIIKYQFTDGWKKEIVIDGCVEKTKEQLFN